MDKIPMIAEGSACCSNGEVLPLRGRCNGLSL